MKAVSRSLSTKLARIQNNVGKAPATFQIDLAQNSLNSVSVIADEVQIPEFVKGLRMEGKLYAFTVLSNEEIEEQILNYTKRLHTARIWRDTGIDNILDKMPNEEFDRMTQVAIEKAMPLFRYDYRGYMPKERPRDSFFVGVPDKVNNRLYKNDYFKSKLTGTMDVDFASIGVNDRIIIYRQVGVVPAYTLFALPDYQKEYAWTSTWESSSPVSAVRPADAAHATVPDTSDTSSSQGRSSTSDSSRRSRCSSSAHARSAESSSSPTTRWRSSRTRSVSTTASREMSIWISVSKTSQSKIFLTFRPFHEIIYHNYRIFTDASGKARSSGKGRLL